MKTDVARLFLPSVHKCSMDLTLPFFCSTLGRGYKYPPTEDADDELARAMRESLDLYRAPRILPDMSSPIFRPPMMGCASVLRTSSIGLHLLGPGLGFRKQLNLN